MVSTGAGEPTSGFVAVGRVLGAWGIKGAAKIESLSDYPERFARGAEIWLRGERHVIESRHTTGRSLVIKLSGIDDPNAVAALQGVLLEWPEQDLPPLADGQYYQHDLVGLSAVTDAGDVLGSVVSLLPTGANDVLIVRGELGEYLLPLIADVVHSVDLERRTLTVELMPGLEPTPVAVKSARSPNPTRRRSGARQSPRSGGQRPEPGAPHETEGATEGDSSIAD